MKLPQINYGGRVGVNQTIGPQAAVQDYRAKQGVLQEGFRVGEQIAEQKIENDAARANAAYRDQVFKTQEYLATKDVLSRDELIALGADETNQNIRWQDDDGNDIQSFKRYEVEAPLMAQAMETTLNESGANIASTRYRQAWQNSVRENNQEEVLRIAKRSAGEAEKYEYKQAIADVEALSNNPTAQIEYLKTSPAFDKNPEVKQKYINRAKDAEFSIDANQVIDNGTDAQLQAFADKMKDPEQRAEMPIDEKRAVVLTNRADSEIRARQSAKDRLENKSDRAQAKTKAEKEAVAGEMVSDYITALSTGQDIPKEEIDQVRVAASGTKYEEKFNVAYNADIYSVMTKDQRNEKMAGMSGLADADQNKAYIEKEMAINKGLDDYGIGYAYQQEIEEPIAIEMGNPESWLQRIAQADRMSVHYGRPVSPFTQGEVDDFSSIVDTMTTGEQMQMIDTFASTPEVWSQFDKAGNQVFALVGTSGDQELADLALNGQKAIDNGLTIPPTDKEYKIATTEYLGGVYDPEDQAAIIETAKAVYASLAPSGEEGMFDPDAWNKALKMTTGGVDAVNGSDVQVPRGTDGDVMQTFVDEFTPEQVKRFGGVSGYTDEEAAAFIQDARWKSVGNDTYRVLDAGGQSLMSPPSARNPLTRPLIITYSQNDATEVAASEAYRKWARQHIKTSGSYQPTEAY